MLTVKWIPQSSQTSACVFSVKQLNYLYTIQLNIESTSHKVIWINSKFAGIMYTGRFLVCISGSELRVSTCSVIDWLDFIHIAHKHHLKFLAGDAFVITIVALLPWCSSVCPSICLSGTGVHCDHTEHVSVDLSSWLDSPMFWAPWRQSMSTYSQPSFTVPPGREVGYGCTGCN